MTSPLEKAVFDRAELLLGPSAMERIRNASVILFGVGGVGSWCAEGLVRSGIRNLTLVDFDSVCASNVNRQLQATTRTLGRAKVEVLRERLLEINPTADITAIRGAFSAETADSFHLERYDYIIDAIDSLKDKAALILHASRTSGTFFSSMGAARKLSPGGVRTGSFWDVRGCPLGAALRKRFRKAGTLPERDFLCVYDEEVLPNLGEPDDGESKGRVNGSLVHVTAVFGFTLCGLVLQDLCAREG